MPPAAKAIRIAASSVALVALAFFALGVARAHEGHSTPWAVPPSEKLVKNPVAAGADSIGRGKPLYAKNCLACHGATGDGKGPVAQRLGFTAGDLTDANHMAVQTDGELFWKIATGRDPMPGYKKDRGFTDSQIWDLVNYTRTLAASSQTKPAAK